MALVYVDGFDNYGSITNMARGRWQFAYGALYTQGTGRFSGYAAGINIGASLNMRANNATAILGVAMKMGATGSTVIEFTDSGVSKVGATLNWDTGVITLYVRSGASTTTTLASSLPGVIMSNSWTYLEFKMVIHDTTGEATIRINGAVVVTYSGDTNRYLNAYANLIYFSAASTLLDPLYLDDLYLCDSSTGAGTRANNDFLGDKRVATMYPASDSAVQWTPLASIYRASDNAVTSGRNVTVVANRVYIPGYYSSSSYGSPLPSGAVIASQDCTITSITLYAITNTPGIHIRPVVYTEDPANTDRPKDKLTLGDEMTGLASGLNTVPFGTGAVALTKGTKYWVGFIVDAGVTLGGWLGAFPEWRYLAATYPTAPTTFDWAASTNTTNVPVVGYTVTAQNYGNVQESNPDTVSYNYTDTLNDQDLFTVAPALATTAVVYGVQVSGSFKKDDANSRSVAPLIKSGATTSQGADLSLNADFVLTSDMFPVDPATSTDWVTTAVNSALIGYKVTV